MPIGQRLPTPQRQRLAQSLLGIHRVAISKGGLALAHQRVKARDVDVIADDGEQVAVSPRYDRLLA